MPAMREATATAASSDGTSSRAAVPDIRSSAAAMALPAGPVQSTTGRGVVDSIARASGS